MPRTAWPVMLYIVTFGLKRLKKRREKKKEINQDENCRRFPYSLITRRPRKHFLKGEVTLIKLHPSIIFCISASSFFQTFKYIWRIKY
jgi:hypothetical protein